MRCVVGIDPGLTGALVVWRDGRFHTLLATVSTPIRKGRRDYLVSNMWDALKQLPPYAEVSLEKQWAQVRRTPQGLRREGATQSFRLGYGYGLWYALVIAAGLRLYTVAPVTWKRYFGLLTQSKSAGWLKLIERAPEAMANWKGLTLSTGVVDAMLLALYRLEHQNDGGTSDGRTTAPAA